LLFSKHGEKAIAKVRRTLSHGVRAAVRPDAMRCGGCVPAHAARGFLDSRPSDAMSDRLRAFRQGFKDAAYVRGREYRDRIPLGRGSFMIVYRRWRPNWTAAKCP
jgi:hypothetical protein